MGDKQLEEDDAPLDFSIKRPSPTSSAGGSDSAEEERPGVLRSPELGQTAVPPRHHGLMMRPRQLSSGASSGGSSSPPPLEPIMIKPEEKIGEPQPAMPGSTVPTAALPAYPPGSLLPNLAAVQGMLSGSPLPSLASLDPKKQQQAGKGGGGTRPFKAYPKEPLSLPLGYFGLPGMNPFPGLDNSNGPTQQPNSEEMYKQYRDYVLKMQQEQQQKLSGGLPLDKSPPMHKENPSKLPASPTSVSSTSSLNGGSVPTSPAGSVVPASSPSSSSNSTVSTTTGTTGGGSSSNKRKRLNTLPDDQKDQAYWERRRKNNDAAKRSRDARRAKEDEIAIRAAFLEQENLKLRVEVTALKNETAKLRCMLYNS